MCVHAYAHTYTHTYTQSYRYTCTHTYSHAGVCGGSKFTEGMFSGHFPPHSLRQKSRLNPELTDSQSLASQLVLGIPYFHL